MKIIPLNNNKGAKKAKPSGGCLGVAESIKATRSAFFKLIVSHIFVAGHSRAPHSRPPEGR